MSLWQEVNAEMDYPNLGAVWEWATIRPQIVPVTVTIPAVGLYVEVTFTAQLPLFDPRVQVTLPVWVSVCGPIGTPPATLIVPLIATFGFPLTVTAPRLVLSPHAASVRVPATVTLTFCAV